MSKTVNFKASVQPLDMQVMELNYRQIVSSLEPGKMIVMNFPEGTTAAEIHKVRTHMMITAARVFGSGKVQSRSRGTTLYLVLIEDVTPLIEMRFSTQTIKGFIGRIQQLNREGGDEKETAD